MLQLLWVRQTTTPNASSEYRAQLDMPVFQMGVKADVDAARSGSTSDAELLEFLAQRASVIATELVYVPCKCCRTGSLS